MRAAARSGHSRSRDVRTAAAADRQVDVKGGAGARRTLDVDLAVMALDDFAHDREPEAGTFAIAPEAVARFEDATGHRRVQAYAVVSHRESHAGRRAGREHLRRALDATRLPRLHGNLDGPVARRDGLGGVEHQIQYELFDARRIGIDERNALAHGDLQVDRARHG